MSVYVIYINPNFWTDLDEIWHGGGPRGQEGSWGGGQPGTPHPLGTECIKGVHNLATFWAILGKIGQLFTHHLVTLVVNNFGAGIVAKMTFITKSRYAIFTIYLHFADNFLNWSQCHTLEPCSSGYG